MPFLNTSLESLAPMLAMSSERLASSSQGRYDVVACRARDVEAGDTSFLNDVSAETLD